ncbi:unnamed protein product, partial [Allacma fusca]
MYIPGAANLFSEGVAARAGFKLIRDSDKTEYFDKDGEGPIADYKERLYIMRFRPIQAKAFVAISDKNKRMWHHRFAHINCSYIRASIEQGAILGIGIEDAPTHYNCEGCQLGKQAKKPFPRNHLPSGYRQGEKIHADLAGPMPVASLNGARYFLILKDDYSGYRAVYFLKTKDQTVECLIDFIAFIQNQT